MMGDFQVVGMWSFLTPTPSYRVSIVTWTSLFLSIKRSNTSSHHTAGGKWREVVFLLESRATPPRWWRVWRWCWFKLTWSQTPVADHRTTCQAGCRCQALTIKGLFINQIVFQERALPSWFDSQPTESAKRDHLASWGVISLPVINHVPLERVFCHRLKGSNHGCELWCQN